MDQNLTYRVNIDDSNFQAKLTQMRASIDTTMGGVPGMGGMGGFSPAMSYGMMGMMAGNGFGPMNMGGLSDFGSQIRPVTYTPAAIAMQPHFGMIQVQQTLSQAGLGGMGIVGQGISGAVTNFRAGGFGNMLFGPDMVPPQITAGEYAALSARAAGGRVGDAVAMGAFTVGSTAASLIGGGIGTAFGESLFAGGAGKLAGGLVGGMFGGALVSAYANQVTDMMADNRRIQSSLESGSFRFIGGGQDSDPLTGRGFSRRSRANIASSIQDMQLKDVRFGANEYGQILEAGMQMDMFSGTRDVDDFKQKFQGLVENVKTVASVLHTSLKDGIEVMRGFRDMGVTDPAQVDRMTLGSETMGRMSGRTGMEMMAIGQTGAEIFRGTGISMARGFELNQQNTVMIRNMLNNGLIDRDTIGQMGGENAAAQQLTTTALAGFQTTMGRGALMASYDPKTGGLRSDFMQQIGSQSAMTLASRAAALTPNSIISLQANQEDIISKMSPMQMQLFGMGTRMSQARMLLDAGYGDDLETNYKYISKQQGVGIDVIKTELGMLHQSPQQLEESMQNSVDSMKNQQAMEDIRNRYGTKRISNFFKGVFVKPVSDGFMRLSTSVGESWDRGMLKLTGAAAVNSEIAGSKYLIEQGEALGTSDAAGVTDARGNLYDRLIGGQTSSELADAFNQYGRLNTDNASVTFNGATAQLFKDEASVQEYASRNGLRMNIIGERNGQIMAMSTGEMKKETDNARNLQSSQEGKDKAEKIELSHDSRKNLRFAARANGGDIDLETAGKAIWGDEFSLDKLKKGQGYGGMDADTTKALLARYLEQDSDLTGKARKEFDYMTGSRLGAAAGARGRKELVDEAELITSNIKFQLGRGGNVSFFNGAKSEDVIKIAKYVAGGGDEIDAVDALRSLGVKDVDKKLRELGNLSPEAKEQIMANARKVEANVAEASKLSEAATGGAGANNAVAVGDLSKNTYETISKMADQLVSNYKQLIAMQTQLNALQKQGGK